MNIIGVSAFYHDSAACLIRDGRLIAAAEEERFSRRKHDASFPTQALRYCLKAGSIDISEVDCVAYYEDPLEKAARQLWTEGMNAHGYSLPQIDPTLPAHSIRAAGFDGPIEIVSHHESHAASAFYFSGFQDAAILTVDAVGEWTTTAYGRGGRQGIEIRDTVSFPDSLGLFYSTITAYLGFRVNEDEYKVMGLAPYGRPIYAEKMRELIFDRDAGQFELNLKYYAFMNGSRMYSDLLSDLLGASPRQPNSDITAFHEDVACSLQRVLEELLLAKARYLHALVPSPNLCMAGGVALNCVANSRLLQEGPFDQLFVQPAAGDSGGSLGAAAVAYVRQTGQTLAKLKDVYIGPEWSDSAITALLDGTDIQYRSYLDGDATFMENIAARLRDGQVIGWFQGRMEFGPRALGNRSILADPRDPSMRDRVNNLVKQREGFRPFAPAVLLADAQHWFHIDHESPFMLETFMVKGKSLPSITHIDGSARVQTVDGSVNPCFAELIERFKSLTGCPVLLNTSFNMAGEPIVCTPVDAIRTFVRSDIDCLCLGHNVIERAGLPSWWTESGSWFETQALLTGNSMAINTNVYTFL